MPRFHYSLIVIILFSFTMCMNQEFTEQDDDFAEFDEFDSSERDKPNIAKVVPGSSQQSENKNYAATPSVVKQADTQIEAADDEVEVQTDEDFEHFQDAEEFEGFEEAGKGKSFGEAKITITEVPVHLERHWENYWLEMLMVFGLLIYFVNFAIGKNHNYCIANSWFQTHRGLLEDNFALVGDDGSQDRADISQALIKESESVYTLWCSGRTCCEGMLVELKMLKRQDLVSIVTNALKPRYDQVHIRVIINSEDMDSFVFCVATRKTGAVMSREMVDISTYCPERKSAEKYELPSQYCVMGEIGEATSAMLDSKVVSMFHKYPDYIDYIHISDQFAGVKSSNALQEPANNPATATVDSNGTPKKPTVSKCLCFGFNMVPLRKNKLDLNEAMEQMKPLMQLVFYFIEKIKRYRMSKEGRIKSDKNRHRVEEAYLKSTHQARAEAAAAKREEKRRLEKERILAEDDPDKQRRWEEKEQKRQAKRRAPKMKQLKVKAL